MDDSFGMGYALGSDSNNNNGNNGMWGDGAWWIIIILAILWGNNGFGGFGGNNGGGLASTFATQADIQRGFDTSNTFSKLEGINSGLCDGFYAVNTSLLNGFHGVDNAICSSSYQSAQMANNIQSQLQSCCCGIENQIQQNRFDNQVAINGLSTQLAQCCCENRYERAQDTCAITTAMANNTRDIIDNQNYNARQILDYLCQDKISTLQNENQALRLAASQQAQNNAIGAMISASEATILRRTGSECPTAAYIVQPPQPVSFATNCSGQAVFNNGYGYNNGGCGCGGNNGCGCC